jgi:hypothetical protein
MSRVLWRRKCEQTNLSCGFGWPLFHEIQMAWQWLALHLRVMITTEGERRYDLLSSPVSEKSNLSDQVLTAPDGLIRTCNG